MMNHGAALVLLNSLVSRKTLANEVAKQLLHHLQIPSLVGLFVPAMFGPGLVRVHRFCWRTDTRQMILQ